jgi:hypothetical protein
VNGWAPPIATDRQHYLLLPLFIIYNRAIIGALLPECCSQQQIKQIYDRDGELITTPISLRRNLLLPIKADVTKL